MIDILNKNSKTMQKYFLVYDDEAERFAEQRVRLLNSVKEFSNFETISFKKSEIDPEFLEKNKHIFQIPVGDGAWLWKPYIISKMLEKMQDGDLLFYMDANYYFVEEFENLYNQLMKERDLLVWTNKPSENVYPMWHLCFNQVLEKYNMIEKLYGKNEYCEPWAGAILMRKSSFTFSLIQEWLQMCQIKEDLWGDEESYKTQNKEYSEKHRVQHRNDQSLLGVLLYKHNIPMEYMEKKYLQNQRNPW